MTFAEVHAAFQEPLPTSEITGTQYDAIRKYLQAKEGDVTVAARHNYRLTGNRMFLVEGIHVSVWLGGSGFRYASGVTTDPTDVLPLIHRLVDEAGKLCEHQYGERRNIGNCLNVYTCPKCGQEFTVDSSD